MMMHSYSPSHRELVVPGIGFPQNISIPADTFDLERAGRTTNWTPGGTLTRRFSVASISMVKRFIQTTPAVPSSVGR